PPGPAPARNGAIQPHAMAPANRHSAGRGPARRRDTAVRRQGLGRAGLEAGGGKDAAWVAGAEAGRAARQHGSVVLAQHEGVIAANEEIEDTGAAGDRDDAAGEAELPH